MIKLVCPECQHDNEPERIYCHHCGARLDRSAIASRVSPKENLKETQKRVRNLFDPKGIKIRLQFFRICKLILGAFVVAAVVQMLLPPDLPPEPAKEGIGISQINFDLENAVTRHAPAQLQYTDDQVNDHLRYVLKNKQSILNKPFIEFRRAVVEFGEGLFTVTVERSVLRFLCLHELQLCRPCGGCQTRRVEQRRENRTAPGSSSDHAVWRHYFCRSLERAGSRAQIGCQNGCDRISP